VGVGEDPFSSVAESDGAEAKDFGLAWARSGNELTGSHGEEESSDDEVDCMVMHAGPGGAFHGE